MSHEKILAMLSGHDAQHPMPFTALLKKSGIDAETLKRMLLDMYHGIPKPINYATITKGMKTETVYWPTGVVMLRPGPQGIVISPAKYEAARPSRIAPPAKLQPNTANVQQTAIHNNQEQTMTKPTGAGKGSPGALNQTLYHLIEAAPGIGQKALITHALKACPDETQTHILKTLSNMSHVTKKITAIGKRGNLTYWTKDSAPATASSPIAKQEASAIGPVEAKPLAEAILHAAAAHADEESAEYYGLNLNDEGCLFISVGEIDLRLNPAQTKRLHRFMGRLSL